MDPTAKEAAPKQEKTSDPVLGIFDSLMSVPSGLVSTALEIGVGAMDFVKGLAKGMANMIMPNNITEPAKA